MSDPEPMKLRQALQIVERQPEGEPFPVALACGFEPLHLQTFLTAELSQRLTGERAEVSCGRFDDIVGNVERAAEADLVAVAVVLEWSDLDPRLGVRRLGGWPAGELEAISDEIAPTLDRLSKAIRSVAARRRVVLVAPTLPLPPLFHQPPALTGREELALRGSVNAFLAELALVERVRIAGGQLIDQRSPLRERRDLASELYSGFPYTLSHASVIAAVLAELIVDAPPLKGLITDLDETLWCGILDELGSAGVAWDLDSGAQRHGLYQQLLASLAGAGTLIAVASRNDTAAVERALARRDLLIEPEELFPIEVGWGAKSASVRRILAAWNVSADAVAFVDDDPLELDEVKTAFPAIETIPFPRDDEHLWTLLTELRTRFGRPSVGVEDHLRGESIRRAATRVSPSDADGASGDFLAGVGGVIALSTGGGPGSRALELINKTNQFNLNGVRLRDATLAQRLDHGEELLTAHYEDRYGPLGLIAALLVRLRPPALEIDVWAQSCRAFSRRIEHHLLSYLFTSYQVSEIGLAFAPTGRNAAVSEFLSSLLGEPPAGPVRLRLAEFRAQTPPLVHLIREPGT